MPLVSCDTDPVALTLTITGHYPVSVARLWQAWADARQLERFWGPPAWPATFTRHELIKGGRSAYHMTGPAGETMGGYWIVDEVDAPNQFTAREGFAGPDGEPDDSMPATRMQVTFSATPTGAQFVAVSRYPSIAAMEQMIEMGVVEGMRDALGQLDTVLADLRDHAANFATSLELLDDTHVRITRELRGPIALVWRAHHDASLIKRWMLGPDGWTMPVCDLAENVGDSYRYEWANEATGERFGFEGELTEREAPSREVSTERMIGMPGPGTVNELVLTPLPGAKTLLTLTITYDSLEMRDMILATGMVDGMELSYARMESVLS